jgi:alkylation response protein AidB-like acyl-CoA dehydrogenase
MFIYDKRDGGVDVRHIEHKLGIHGSPTCELVYKNAKAELCGDRRMGLIKYVMSLMNGARLGIAAQSVGLEQEAYNEALAYAKDRAQFGKKIITFPAVYDMLSRMKARLDASRSILYQTARYVDIYKALEDIAKERKLTPEERAEMKTYNRLADAFTPLAKGMASEYANQNAYDCISIHAGRASSWSISVSASTATPVSSRSTRVPRSCRWWLPSATSPTAPTSTSSKTCSTRRCRPRCSR